MTIRRSATDGRNPFRLGNYFSNLLDEAHANQLDELRQHFHLAADDTVRLVIRLAHARHKQKPDVLVPEFKPRAKRDDWFDDEDHMPE